MSRITAANIHQHGGPTLHSFPMLALAAVVGANLVVGIDCDLRHKGTDGKPDFFALENDVPFNTAKYMQAKQTDGNMTRMRIGWSDTPTIEGVKHWHSGSADNAGLFGYDKGHDDVAGHSDPNFDEQLPGAKKYLIITPLEGQDSAGNYLLTLSAR
jgi:hypothetical protein